jgi:hypothetical protein
VVDEAGRQAARAPQPDIARVKARMGEEWEDSPEGYPQTPPYQWWIWHDSTQR